MTQERMDDSEYWEDAYREERAKLSSIIRVIRERTDLPTPIEAADKAAFDAISNVLDSLQSNTLAALDQPYFGRIDYIPLEPSLGSLRTVYLGGGNIPDTNVYGWTNPIGRLWYTNDNEYPVRDSGKIRVRVDLKRYLRIRRQQLEEFNDTYRRLPSGESSSSGNLALDATLSVTGPEDGQLQVIIETIQPDQYESIANLSDQVLVVQGAAGSGKSEIGLHRIAYLLSPFNAAQNRERPTPDTILFLGPSRSFLEYISDLLPSLGVQQRIRQTTFRDWLRSQQSGPINLRSGIWTDLLEKGSMTNFDEEAEAFKGSMLMADVLERRSKELIMTSRREARSLPPLTVTLSVSVNWREFAVALSNILHDTANREFLGGRQQEFVNLVVDELRGTAGQERSIVTFDRDLLLTSLNRASSIIRGDSRPDIARQRLFGLVSDRIWAEMSAAQSSVLNTVSINRTEIQRTLAPVFADADDYSRLNLRRKQFVDGIVELIWQKGKENGLVRRAGTERQLRAIKEEAVELWIASTWPHIDYRYEYISLLSDPEKMVGLSRNALEIAEADALKESVRGSTINDFQDSDAGALVYLDHLLNETIAGRYRHIVVDEAQDISPIEFRLLRLSSVNNWFTILGDTVQRLTPYRGIHRWRDLERVLGRSAIKVQQARVSYRSNQHITRFNNRILRLFDTYIDAPIPYGREGHRVEYHNHGSSEEMFRGVVDEFRRIRSLDSLSNARIAILVRDRNNLNRFHKFCQDNGVREVVLLGQEGPTSRTVLGRIPEAKGLEYDAVIVMGVNETFTSTTFNQKLLYLACTRAKHYLALHWHSGQSPILKSIYGGGVKPLDHTHAGRRR